MEPHKSRPFGLGIYDEQDPSDGPDVDGSPRVLVTSDGGLDTVEVTRTGPPSTPYWIGTAIDFSIETTDPPFDTWDARTASGVTVVIDQLIDTGVGVRRLIARGQVEEITVDWIGEHRIETDATVAVADETVYAPIDPGRYRSLSSEMINWHDRHIYGDEGDENPTPYPDAVLVGENVPPCPDCGVRAWTEADHAYAELVCASCGTYPVGSLRDELRDRLNDMA